MDENTGKYDKSGFKRRPLSNQSSPASVKHVLKRRMVPQDCGDQFMSCLSENLDPNENIQPNIQTPPANPISQRTPLANRTNSTNPPQIHDVNLSVIQRTPLANRTNSTKTPQYDCVKLSVDCRTPLGALDHNTPPGNSSATRVLSSSCAHEYCEKIKSMACVCVFSNELAYHLEFSTVI